MSEDSVIGADSRYITVVLRVPSPEEAPGEGVISRLHLGSRVADGTVTGLAEGDALALLRVLEVFDLSMVETAREALLEEAQANQGVEEAS